MNGRTYIAELRTDSSTNRMHMNKPALIYCTGNGASFKPHFDCIHHFGKVVHNKDQSICVLRPNYYDSLKPHAAKSASARPACRSILVSAASVLAKHLSSSTRRLLMDFTTSSSTKPPTTRSVHVVCVSSQRSMVEMTGVTVVKRNNRKAIYFLRNRPFSIMRPVQVDIKTRCFVRRK